MLDPGSVPGPASLERERDVVALLQQGDREALDTLYRWFGEPLYRKVILPRVGRVELAEDVLRDTFRTALERIDTFRLEDRSIYFWLRRIAINKAMDVHRADARRQRLSDALAREQVVDPPADPHAAVDRAETRELVHEALERLNPRYATALRLRLLEGRSRADCAEAMGVTVGNFDVILHRAARAFRKVYPPR